MKCNLSSTAAALLSNVFAGCRAKRLCIFKLRVKNELYFKLAFLKSDFYRKGSKSEKVGVNFKLRSG